jgi:excisionase family DNA binding protein
VRLTPKQAAERANVSVSLIYAWCNTGALPHYRLGRPGKRGKIVIDEADFERFLATLKVSAQEEEEYTYLK